MCFPAKKTSIKGVLWNPIASNGVCSLQRFSYNEFVKWQYFV